MQGVSSRVTKMSTSGTGSGLRTDCSGTGYWWMSRIMPTCYLLQCHAIQPSWQSKPRSKT